MKRLTELSSARGRYGFESPSESGTIEAGTVLGGLLPAGSAVSLEGGLGSGKTVFTKGVCAGLGVDGQVLSPTFILVEEYRGEFPVMHFDLYRLEEVEELERIGFFDAVDGINIVIVEWGDRIPDGLLDFDLRVSFSIAGENARIIGFDGPENILEALGKELDG